jgi:hypothetical protein
MLGHDRRSTRRGLMVAAGGRACSCGGSPRRGCVAAASLRSHHELARQRTGASCAAGAGLAARGLVRRGAGRRSPRELAGQAERGGQSRQAGRTGPADVGFASGCAVCTPVAVGGAVSPVAPGSGTASVGPRGTASLGHCGDRRRRRDRSAGRHPRVVRRFWLGRQTSSSSVWPST